MGLYGTSWGGASAIWCAAFDERIKVIVNSVGVSDGERWLKNARRPHEWQEFNEKVSEAAKDSKQAAKLWEISEEITGLRLN